MCESLRTANCSPLYALTIEFGARMPVATGGDLAFHLRYEKALVPKRMRGYAAEVASGLAHLHSLSMLYRDLKPANILLTGDGHCVISDLGLVKIFPPGTPIAELRTKGRAGTSGYWAPEVLEGGEYGVASEWWSFGVFCCELLIGHCIFGKTYSGIKNRDEATLKWDPIKLPSELPEPKGALKDESDDGHEEKKKKKKKKGGDRKKFPKKASKLILSFLKRDEKERLGFVPTADSRDDSISYGFDVSVPRGAGSRRRPSFP